MVRIEFATENDAFVESFGGEVAHLLHTIAGRIARGEQAGNVQDSNGNTVGKWEAAPDV
jgi:hypothetical protein